MKAKREKGLCYFCEEPYTFEPEPLSSNEPTIDVGNSLQALSGGTSFQTLVIEGRCKNQVITRLIDSGSTHNFLDPNVAKQVGSEILPTDKLLVTVVDGSNINTTALCPAFQWTMQGEEFIAEVRLLPLGGCDTVLGVQWLRKVEPVSMGLNELSLSIHYRESILKLQAKQSKGGQLKFISGSALQRYCSRRKFGVLAQLKSMYAVSDTVPADAAITKEPLFKLI